MLLLEVGNEGCQHCEYFYLSSYYADACTPNTLYMRIENYEYERKPIYKHVNVYEKGIPKPYDILLQRRRRATCHVVNSMLRQDTIIQFG